MKKTLHKAKDRGYFDHGWLQTHHSFSFADYYNPAMMGFGALRVINDDAIAPGAGFGLHPHDNVEIVTVMLSGALEHQDSMGNKAVIRAGDIQVMSAGTGVWHAEYNASAEESTQLLQIWILPRTQGVTPRYEDRTLDQIGERNSFQTLVGPEGSGTPLWIHQDAFVSLSHVDKGKTAEYAVRHPGNGIYLFVIEGSGEVEKETLYERDAVALIEADEVAFTAQEDTRLILLEVPMTF